VLSEELPAQLAWFRQGSVVAGYRLEAQVGAGGMAVVFRARDERLGRPVALKILAPGLASDPAFRRRFIAESRAAAAVDDPHIIPIYEAGEAEGALFIAMRFVQGGDLRHVLAREGALPPGRAAEFLSPVASALDAAHGAGLVHRDVKPANILVDVRLGRPDHVYLSDFGVSKGAAASMSLTGTGQFLGTPDYSAPEQIQGRPVDGRADQYALACVTYQLLTGEAPFERDQGMAVLLAHLSEPPPSLVERRPDLPAAADEVLARALAKVPEKRFGSCADFADALRAALGLASYDPRGTAPVPAPDHPPTVIAAPQPESVGSEGSGKPVDPAEPAPGPAEPAPALADPAPGVSDDSAAPVPADLAAPATIDALPGRPLAAADAHTADQPLPSIPPADGEVRPTRRRHRIVAIVLVGAVLAVVCVVGVLANLQPGNITEKLTATLTDPGASGVASVAFSPNGATLAAGGGNGKIYLWNVATRKVTGTFTDLQGVVSSAAFSPDGATLAVGDARGNIYLWDVATRKVTAILPDPESAPVASVAFNPDGTELAVGDATGSTSLWNVPAGTQRTTLTDENGLGAASVAFSPDGATLAVGRNNGRIYLWHIS
jgi:serine/threonine protein kinase